MKCPYNAEAPQSDDGVMAWALVQQHGWRLKAAGLATVTGLDLDVARRQMLSAGVDPDITDELLGAAEAAAVVAYNEKEGNDDGQD